MLSYSDAVRGRLPKSFFGADSSSALAQLNHHLNGSVNTTTIYLRHYIYKRYSHPYAVANSIVNAFDITYIDPISTAIKS